MYGTFPLLNHVYLNSVQQMVSGELAGEGLQTGFSRHGLPPQRAPLDTVYPLREHLNSVQRIVSGGYCEGLFPDTVCWTRLRNTWTSQAKMKFSRRKHEKFKRSLKGRRPTQKTTHPNRNNFNKQFARTLSACFLPILEGKGGTICTNCPEIVCANCVFIWVGVFWGGYPHHDEPSKNYFSRFGSLRNWEDVKTEYVKTDLDWTLSWALPWKPS